MGLSLSLLFSSPKQILKHRLFGLRENAETVIVRSISFDSTEGETLRKVSFKKRDSNNNNNISTEGETLRKVSFKKRDSNNNNNISDELVIEEALSLKKWDPKKLKLETTVSFKILVSDEEKLNSRSKGDELTHNSNPEKHLPEPSILFYPKPVSELNAAALKVQKVYKSYRTRRNLADCAVVTEKLWWKALDFATLKRCSISFFNIEKPESAVSRWARARTRAAKVGKGLSKDEKAQKLAVRHWLEAIDPRHRYGLNLHMYYDVWFDSQSSQPFFFWLDIGDGKEVNLEKCPRTDLQHQCVVYLGPKERKAYEVIVDNGKLVYKQSGMLVDTIEGSKWIFVLSTSRNLYVGEKKKGQFQHSSFLAGGATTTSGRLVAHNGVLEATWPFSGHYRPTEENFMEFISFLEEHNVDLSDVKRCAIDDDIPPMKCVTNEELKSESRTGLPPNIESADANNIETVKDSLKAQCLFESGKTPIAKDCYHGAS